MGKHTNFSILGGNLCLPLFGCKVPYQPGSVALIRGHHLEHLVTDFTGPRYFVVGTNHESTKQAVWRKLGRAPPLSPKDIAGCDDDPEATCINMMSDEDDDRELTNLDIHGSGVLFSSSSDAGEKD